MHQSFRILDTRLQINCDEESLVEAFLGVFSAFAVEPEAVAGPEPVLRVDVDGAAGTYSDGRSQVLLAPPPLRRAHVYNLLYRSLVRSFRGFILLHGAVVARRGKAWLISGPSGAGKTTLARELALRGLDLLTDDLAPLALEDGRLHPFPRRLGLEKGHGAAAGDFVRLGDKEFVAASDLGLAAPAAALRPAGVLIMDPYIPATDAGLCLRIGVLPAAADLEAQLKRCHGVQVERETAVPPARTLLVKATGGQAAQEVMAALDRADAGVLFHGHVAGGSRQWADEPAVESLGLRPAATCLLREALNREPQAALMQGYQGRATGLMMDLLGLLEGVPCHRLRPAGIGDTADFVMAWLP